MGLAALDVLSVANMINYFGKSDSALLRLHNDCLRSLLSLLPFLLLDIDEINVHPILMEKGSTKVRELCLVFLSLTVLVFSFVLFAAGIVWLGCDP
jgi:hypothetical protein